MDDPRYLVSYFGRKLVFSGADDTMIQDEIGSATDNLVIARDPGGTWRLFHLAAASGPAPARRDIVVQLQTLQPMAGVTVEPMPGPDRFALHRSRRYLSADQDGKVAFCAAHRKSWELFDGLRPGMLAYRGWRPEKTMGGTQIMQYGLQERLGDELACIDLQINKPDLSKRDSRKLVVWLHNDAHAYFRWCADRTQTDAVDAFVFVSDWQRGRFLSRFALPPERCHVIRNATVVGPPPTQWDSPAPWRLRCAYSSTPERGLSVLLDAWERLDDPRAELHVWSSFRLWGSRYNDSRHHSVLARAARLPGVVYHGIRPNAEIRSAMREMHFLAYPSIVPEASCLAAIEAMAAGCRVIVPRLGALAETTGGFACTYPVIPDAALHAARFAELLDGEFRNPWGGDPSRAAAQVEHTRNYYDWPVCLAAWRALIRGLAG